MKLQRASALILLAATLAAPLTGCGDEKATADESAASRSVDAADLCDAAESWNDEFDARAGEVDTTVAAEMGALLAEAGADFVENVVPTAPDVVREQATDLGQLMVDAGAELSAMDSDAGSPAVLAASGDAPKFAEFMDLMQPAPADADDLDNSTFRYANELVAWLADPCGPKDLEFEQEPEFHSISTSI